MRWPEREKASVNEGRSNRLGTLAAMDALAGDLAGFPNGTAAFCLERLSRNNSRRKPRGKAAAGAPEAATVAGRSALWPPRPPTGGGRSSAISLRILANKFLGDLGHLEGDVAAMAHDLRADLDELLLQSCQRPIFDRSGIAEVRVTGNR